MRINFWWGAPQMCPLRIQGQPGNESTTRNATHFLHSPLESRRFMSSNYQRRGGAYERIRKCFKPQAGSWWNHVEGLLVRDDQTNFSRENCKYRSIHATRTQKFLNDPRFFPFLAHETNFPPKRDVAPFAPCIGAGHISPRPPYYIKSPLFNT